MDRLFDVTQIKNIPIFSSDDLQDLLQVEVQDMKNSGSFSLVVKQRPIML